VRVRGEYKTNREDAINKTMVRSLAQPKKQCNVASDEGSVGFGAKKSAVLGGGSILYSILPPPKDGVFSDALGRGFGEFENPREGF